MDYRCTLIRYADDFVIGFEQREDAERVMAVLGKQFERYGLARHPDKTRLIEFARPSASQRSGRSGYVRLSRVYPLPPRITVRIWGH